MTPAEAGAVQYEEPDWLAEFNQECLRWPDFPRYLQEESAFPEILRRWRHWHATPAGEHKQQPAPATEAIVALAKLKVMPPRSAWQDIPRGDAGGYQHDDHCWFSYNQEQWRVTGIEDKTLFLEKMWFTEKDRESKQIDMSRARWDSYVAAAVAVLDAMRSQENS